MFQFLSNTGLTRDIESTVISDISLQDVLTSLEDGTFSLPQIPLIIIIIIIIKFLSEVKRSWIEISEKMTVLSIFRVKPVLLKNLITLFCFYCLFCLICRCCKMASLMGDSLFWQPATLSFLLLVALLCLCCFVANKVISLSLSLTRSLSCKSESDSSFTACCITVMYSVVLHGSASHRVTDGCCRPFLAAVVVVIYVIIQHDSLKPLTQAACVVHYDKCHTCLMSRRRRRRLGLRRGDDTSAYAKRQAAAGTCVALARCARSGVGDFPTHRTQTAASSSGRARGLAGRHTTLSALARCLSVCRTVPARNRR